MESKRQPFIATFLFTDLSIFCLHVIAIYESVSSNDLTHLKIIIYQMISVCHYVCYLILNLIFMLYVDLIKMAEAFRLCMKCNGHKFT